MRNIARWTELIHPQDRVHGDDMLPRLLAGEKVTVDYRIIRPNDGAIRWIRETPTAGTSQSVRARWSRRRC